MSYRTALIVLAVTVLCLLGIAKSEAKDLEAYTAPHGELVMTLTDEPCKHAEILKHIKDKYVSKFKRYHAEIHYPKLLLLTDGKSKVEGCYTRDTEIVDEGGVMYINEFLNHGVMPYEPFKKIGTSI